MSRGVDDFNRRLPHARVRLAAGVLISLVAGVLIGRLDPAQDGMTQP